MVISVSHEVQAIKRDLIDLHMPVVDGESAARHIKRTTNKNSSVPNIAVSAYGGLESVASSNLSAARMVRPVQKFELVNVKKHPGFKASMHIADRAMSAKVVAVRYFPLRSARIHHSQLMPFTLQPSSLIPLCLQSTLT